MKTKVARYFSQLGRFGRDSISKQSGPTAANSEQTSFSHSRTRGKMRMKCGRVHEIWRIKSCTKYNTPAKGRVVWDSPPGGGLKVKGLSLIHLGRQEPPPETGESSPHSLPTRSQPFLATLPPHSPPRRPPQDAETIRPGSAAETGSRGGTRALSRRALTPRRLGVLGRA